MFQNLLYVLSEKCGFYSGQESVSLSLDMLLADIRIKLGNDDLLSLLLILMYLSILRGPHVPGYIP